MPASGSSVWEAFLASAYCGWYDGIDSIRRDRHLASLCELLVQHGVRNIREVAVYSRDCSEPVLLQQVLAKFCTPHGIVNIMTEMERQESLNGSML